MESVSELGINVKISDKVLNALGKKMVFKKLKLETSRVLALCSLSVLSKETEWQINSFDAIQDFALAGLQWLKHLNKHVKVTINATEDRTLVKSALLENNCDVHEEDVKVISEDPLAHMHSNKYTFIYVEVTGCAVTYLDAVMRSIKHNGVVCLTSTDMAILQNKSPATSYRLYGAKLWNTEYYRELGARVIIANAVQAAARWSKGVEVLLCVAEEHGVTIVFKVLRGSRFGESSMSCLNYLSHCQVCQARMFIPDDLYVIDSSKLPCMCQCSSDGIKAPILMLGPIWSGEIFNKVFLLKLRREMKSLQMPNVHQTLIDLLIIESACCSSNTSESELIEETKKTCYKLNEAVEPNKKRVKLEQGAEESTISSSNCTNGVKESSNGPVLKPTPFYFDVQNHSVKGGNPPTRASVINKLRSDGHRASRTHFGPRCVRTSADLIAFKEALQHIWHNTEK